VAWAEAYLHAQYHLDPSNRVDTIDMGQNWGVLGPRFGGLGSPSNTMSPGWRPTSVPTTTTTVLRPFVRDYPGEPVAEETFNHPPSLSSSNLYQLLPCTTIHSILLVQIMCLAIFLHNLFPCPLWSTSSSGALHLIFHTFLHPISVAFSQHMPIPSQPVLL